MKKCIIVLGMHRSGTSAFAGVLNYMGVDLGPDTMEPSDDNPKGFFENNKVYELNEKILGENDSSWDDFECKIKKITPENMTKYVQEAKKIIDDQFKYSKTFAIKDPRNCLLFPVWERALTEMNIKIEIALPYRNPLEVASSLKKRNKFSYEKSLLLWITHFLNAEFFSREYKRLFISFEDLIDEREKTLNTILDTFSLMLEKKNIKAIDKFLEKNLKHHNYNYENISENLPKFIVSTINQLVSNDMENIKAYDNIRNEFMYSKDLFFNENVINNLSFTKNLSQELQSSKTKVVELEEEVEKRGAWALDLEGQLETSKASISQNQEEITHLTEELSSSKDSLAQTSQELQSSKTKVVELEEEVEKRGAWALDLEGQLETSKASISQNQEEITHLTEELSSSKDSLAQTSQELQSSKTKVVELEEEVEKRGAWALDLEGQLETSKASISQNQEEITHLTEELSSSKDTLGEINQELEGSKTKVTELEDEVEKRGKWAVDLEAQLETSKASISQNQEEITHLTEELSSSKDSLAQTSQELEGSKTKVTELEEEVEKRGAWALDLEGQLETSKASISQNQEEITHLTEELSSSKDSLAQTSQELQSSKTKVTELEEEVEKRGKWALELESQLEISKASISQNQEEITHLTEELNSSKETLNETTQELEGSKTKVVELEEEVEKRGKWALELESQLEISKASISQNQEEITHLTEELNSSKEQNNINVKKVAHMKDDAKKAYDRTQNIEAYQHLFLKHKDVAQNKFYKNLKENKLIHKLNPYSMAKCVKRFKEDMKEINLKFNRIPRAFLEHFDAGRYLEVNSDINQNLFENALEHFILYGFEEIQTAKRKLYNNVEAYTGNPEDTDSFQKYLTIVNQGLKHSQTISSENDHFPLKIIDPTTIEITELSRLEVPKFNNPLVSIIIPAYNQANYTYACIESIIKHTQDVAYEIILMDDKSPNEDARNLEHNIKNITFVSNEENQGFLKNCNAGASLAKGKYIFLLNNDTNVQPYWLSSLVELIESDETIGMVGSRLVYPDGRQQEAGGIVWNDASGWNFGRLDDPTKPEYNYVKEVDYISGAAIMIKASLWNEIGGFDERYTPAYYEDTDLAFEVRRHGYKVMYQPRSIVVHFEGISNGTDLGSGIKKYQVVNHEKFFTKWKDVLLKEHFKNAENVLYARDRSRDKKHILVIDHYVPHYDKDAGSRTMWQYLLMLQEMGYKITFVGDNFFKHEHYTSMLEEAGIEILYGPYYYHNFTSWLENNGHYFDFVYLLRPHISIKYIDDVKKYTSAKIFYNGTDFHFLRMQREYELSKDQKLLSSIDEMEKQEISLFEKVDCVLTISDYEKTYFEKRFPEWNVKVIPTFIYKESFPLSKNDDFYQREGILFVGGFTHAPNLKGVQWFLKNIWPSILLNIPSIKFYIVGSNMPDEISQLANDNIIPKGFVEDSELNELYNSVKVVVAPLTFGAGVKGKIIESICHGVPVVTTSVGAEGIVDADSILSVLDEDSKFANEVQLMYTDQALWNKTRNLEIKYAENNFGYDHAKKLMKTIFTKDIK